MNRSAPRSIDQYLRQLREELAGADSALIQDALYDAEEYLRAEVAAHPDKSESDVLELIASTYGAPDEVASAYRDTEVKVKAAMATPRKKPTTVLGKFFGVFLDPRAYTCLFFMLLSLATGIIYFVFAVTGLVALSAGLAVLIIGVPFFLVFMAVSRVVSLAEGRLIEAMTGERMPRRPVYQGKAQAFWTRIGRNAEGSAHLDHHRVLHLDAADRHRLLRDGGGGTVGEPGIHIRAACRFAQSRRCRRLQRHTRDGACRGGVDSGVGFRTAAADAGGSLAADLDHASGARRRTPARVVRENSAGRARSADRAGGQR